MGMNLSASFLTKMLENPNPEREVVKVSHGR